ncbi:hypothetical protein HFQ13_10545 [Acidithiobacillus sp. VAN18-1]|uniref:Uncharacterized protein n=1 Tax=Igneacidithiobacillus copahuensis TaxID=2724909 RepID=A0AAE3CKC6_9PROT|nr:hypothetical protein [Igneacidithiobacillus copahuensis]MBU2788629.1 hypothetical protein [Igneacidithiobacillus copahuensis]MBU2796687.1 hypothetical protein [Acidithiobacillus sp. VAN18-2]
MAQNIGFLIYCVGMDDDKPSLFATPNPIKNTEEWERYAKKIRKTEPRSAKAILLVDRDNDGETLMYPYLYNDEIQRWEHGSDTAWEYGSAIMEQIASW